MKQFCRLYRKTCHICDKKHNEKNIICNKCLSKIDEFNKKRKCLKCGIPIPVNGGGICVDCDKKKLYFDIAASCYAYKGVFSDAMKDFKFHGGFFRVKIISRLMVEAVLKTGLNFDYIVPVPMLYKNLVKRGYNPPLEAGYLIKKEIKGIYLPSCLIKTRKTAQQSTLKHEERMKNIKGAFKINKRYENRIKGKEILLIDDVLTTGATASECAKILKKAGASAVYVITFLISTK